MRKWLFVSGVVVSAACANNVSQWKQTGPDGSQKGAKPIVLSEGQGTAKDIVTYPGGDRVDWKVIEIPEGKKGKLDLTMTYSTPRPGLRVAFDVFDQWNVPVFTASAKRPERSASIEKAKGKYFVRVYAPRRKDAAQYKLVVDFKEEIAPPPPCPSCINIPDPPKLPDVPEPDVAVVTPPTPPTPPPQPPQPPQPPTTPVTPPPPPAKPVMTRVVGLTQEGDELELKVGAGSEINGVTMDWKVTVLRGDSGQPLSGGTGRIVRVTKSTTYVRVKMTSNQISANPNIKLSPPTP